MATIKQMAARANSGHRNALARIADGVPVVHPNATAGEIRGWRTVLVTLSRWGCVAVIDGRTQLTAIGSELLTTLRKVQS